MTWKMHRPGCYRLSAPLANEHEFAQVKKDKSLWLVEIRQRVSGDLLRYAGKWATLRDAREEATRVLRIAA